MREVLRFFLDPDWEPRSAKRDAKDAERRVERARVREMRRQEFEGVSPARRTFIVIGEYVGGLLIVVIIIGLGILLVVLGEDVFNFYAYVAVGIVLLAFGSRT